MTVDRASETAVPQASSAIDIWLDGLFTGMIGALAVVVWFLVLDIAAGRPLYTPALLGTVLLHGGASAAREITIQPLEIAAYTALHFLIFIAVVAQCFCTIASTTSASRMMFAFSRDRAVPGHQLWRRV